MLSRENNAEERNRALIQAVEDVRLDLVKLLLEEGAMVNWEDDCSRDIATNPRVPRTALTILVFRQSDCLLSDDQIEALGDIAELLLCHDAYTGEAKRLWERRYGAFDPRAKAPDDPFQRIGRLVFSGAEASILVRVGTFQCEPAAGDIAANLATLRVAAGEAAAQGLDLLLLPELFLTGYNVGVDRLRTLACAADGEIIASVCLTAADCRVAIAVGYPERVGDTVYNSCCLIDAGGRVVLNYRKTHLWDPTGEYEKLAFAPGDELPVCNLQLPRSGGWVRVGILICYDSEFPEPCRVLAARGAQIVLLPTGSADRTPTALCPARAMENHVFLVYCNLIGPVQPADSSTQSPAPSCQHFGGQSAIIAPDGTDLARADGVQTGLFAATLDGGAYRGCVARNDYLGERRPELYGLIAGGDKREVKGGVDSGEGVEGLGAPVVFNAAGACPMPVPVLARVKAALDREAEIGGYAAAEEAEAELGRVYDLLGRLLRVARPREELAVVDSATTAWVRAFYAIPLRAGDVLLTTVMEYASNYLAMLQRARAVGAEVQVVPCGEDGAVSVSALEGLLGALGSRVRVVSLVWIPTNGGIVNDAAGVGSVIAASGRGADIVFMIDGCQAVGQVPIDVCELGCQVLTGTGRKYLRGPRGTGFLYVQHEALSRHFGEPASIDLRAAAWTGPESYTVAPTARRFEQWECNFSGLLGLGAAVEYLLDTVGEGNAYSALAARACELRRRLRGISGVALWDRCLTGTGGAPGAGLVTFTVGGTNAQNIKKELLEVGIYVSVTAPSSSLLDAAARGLPDMVRASVNYCNTEAEIDIFCRRLKKIVKYYS